MKKIFVFVLICFFSMVMLSTTAFCHERRVLLISSYHPSFPTFFKQIEGLKSVLDPESVLLDVEFMDSKRFHAEEYLNKFYDLLHSKLSALPAYDVVITSDDNALKFALQYRAQLFNTSPVVFCGVNNQEMARILNYNDNFTGVIEAASIRETAELIPRILPRTKSVFVIVDSTPSGQGDFESFKEQVKSIPSINFNILSLADMSWHGLREKLKSIPEDSVVLLLSAYRDRNNITKTFDDSLAFIYSNVQVPVFHPYEHGLGSGVVGGKVISHYVQGQMAAEIALDIMTGKRIEEIPVVEGGEANRYIFDRDLLKEYGVEDYHLPKGSIILNEKDSIFQKYKFELYTFSILIFALLLFSIVLLVYYIKLRRSEMRVVDSEKRFSLAMAANKDGLWDWDIQTDDVYYSPGYKAMLGYYEDEVPSHVDSWLDLIHEDDRERAFTANAQCIENRTSNFEVEFRMLAKDGAWRWILGRGNAVERDGKGRALRMIGTHTDITDRKRNEEEIRALRNYLRKIIDSMPFVLIGLDEDFLVSQWNEKAEEVSGVSAAQAIGKPLLNVFPRMKPQMDRIEHSLKFRDIHIDSRVARRDNGDIRYEDITIYPISDKGRLGVVIILEDVTERVRLEEMVIHNEKMLSVGGLAAGMAHEINNPLGAILQGTQNIRRRAFSNLPKNLQVAEEHDLEMSDIKGYLVDRDIPKILNGINSAATRAAKIVSNMLSFSRKNKDNFSEHDLPILLDEVIDLAASEYDLATKYDFRKIEIVREYDSNAPAVYCERSEIQQVFLNLLKNGAQSMNGKSDDGGTSCFTLRVRQAGDYAQVEVEDNGQGMNKEVQKRIFEPFYTTKQVGEGTGLGLAISYFIITDLHKGKMEVFSAPGKWTRFVISLPVGRHQDMED